MELKRTITLKLSGDEWSTLVDVADLLEKLGTEMQKLGAEENVILECTDHGVGTEFKARDIFRIANEIDFIADGGTITTS